MIHPELHELDSDDIPNGEAESFASIDPEYFGVMVAASIGVRGQEGGDWFYFLVRSPRFLADEVAREGHVFARNYLVLPRYNLTAIRRAISALCESIEGPDWETVARRIGRYGLWEFDEFYDSQRKRPANAQ